MYIEHPHVAEWRQSHWSRVVDSTFSTAFAAHLETLPWAASRLDWSTFDSRRFEVPRDGDDLTPLLNTPLGGHALIVIVYARDEPSLACLFEDAIKDLDLLYWRAPGTRYFCGADEVAGTVVAAYADFAEYDGVREIRTRS